MRTGFVFSLLAVLSMTLILSSCVTVEKNAKPEPKVSAKCGEDIYCVSLESSLDKKTDCSQDVLCQAVRVGMDSNTSLEDCKFRSSNSAWCYSVKRAIYENNCAVKPGDLWTNEGVCMSLREAIQNKKCVKPKRPVEASCIQFLRAGFSKQKIENFNRQ